MYYLCRFTLSIRGRHTEYCWRDGFGAVLDWLKKWDFQAAEAHAVELAKQSKARLKNYPNCRLFNSPQPSSVVCFVFDGIAASDLATLLSEQKIALRVGEHCAQPSFSPPW